MGAETRKYSEKLAIKFITQDTLSSIAVGEVTPRAAD